MNSTPNHAIPQPPQRVSSHVRHTLHHLQRKAFQPGLAPHKPAIYTLQLTASLICGTDGNKPITYSRLSQAMDFLRGAINLLAINSIAEPILHVRAANLAAQLHEHTEDVAARAKLESLVTSQMEIAQRLLKQKTGYYKFDPKPDSRDERLLVGTWLFAENDCQDIKRRLFIQTAAQDICQRALGRELRLRPNGRYLHRAPPPRGLNIAAE